MFHVVLVEPQIPPNTGNIIRLCANTGAALHLVHPLGFDVSRREVRRAGLDYVEFARVRVHLNFAACVEALGDAALYTVETGGGRPYSAAAFKGGEALIFGSEKKGLSAAVLASVPGEQQLTIPMRPGNRSLNLSNAVAVVVYEAWRQTGFAG
jgi:tRNA (cytidine/uridine-2'-O-)-methyltransferase